MSIINNLVFSSKINEIEESKPISPPNSNNNSIVSDIPYNSNYKKDFNLEKTNNKNNKSYDYSTSFENLRTIFLLDNSIISDNKTINDDNYENAKNVSNSINNIKDSRATFNSIKMSNEFDNSLNINNNLIHINQTGKNNFTELNNNNRYENLEPENKIIKEKNPVIKSNYFHQKQISSQLEFSMDMMQYNTNMKMSYNKLCSLYNKKNSLFYLLIFLNNEELKNFLNLNKHIRLLINTTLRDIYYPNLIEKLKKTNPNIELIKSKIQYEELKKGIKIDIIANIRFLSEVENFAPKNISIVYLYRNFNFDKDKKKERFIDYYSFDYFPEKTSYFPSLYMIREFTSYYLDNLQKTFIQPILPFKTYDQALLNLNIYSPENFFIEPKSVKIKFFINPLDNTQYIKGENPRICEYEDVCVHWKNISFLKEEKIIIEQLTKVFTPQFNIIRILYDDIGYLVFKVTLKAIQSGLIYNKEELGIDLLIKEKNDIIINEIKKNNLLFEKRNVFELRVGDIIIFYLKK